MDVNTLIGLGILGAVGYLARGMFSIREDMREVKTLLGVNGHADTGLVAQVQQLRSAKHDHANRLTILDAQVSELRERSP